MALGSKCPRRTEVSVNSVCSQLADGVGIQPLIWRVAVHKTRTRRDVFDCLTANDTVQHLTKFAPVHYHATILSDQFHLQRTSVNLPARKQRMYVGNVISVKYTLTAGRQAAQCTSRGRHGNSTLVCHCCTLLITATDRCQYSMITS